MCIKNAPILRTRAVISPHEKKTFYTRETANNIPIHYIHTRIQYVYSTIYIVRVCTYQVTTTDGEVYNENRTKSAFTPRAVYGNERK